MTTSDINRDTAMPHRIQLGDVLGSIEMTPGEVSEFLARIAGMFAGTAHNNLYRKLNDHAAMVADPRTYGYEAPQATAASPEEEYVAPSTPRYAQRYGDANVGAGVAAEQQRPAMAPFAKLDSDPSSNVVLGPTPSYNQPAAQGQATTPDTLRTGAADASRNQGTQTFAPNATPAVGEPGPFVGGVALSDDERRQYQHPQGSALDRAARRQKLQEELDAMDRESAQTSSESTQTQPSAPERPRHFDGSVWRYNDDNSEVPQSELAGGFTVRSETPQGQ